MLKRLNEQEIIDFENDHYKGMTRSSIDHLEIAATRAAFVNDGKQYLTSSPFTHTEQKRDLLMNSFYKFSKKGKQNISAYSAPRVHNLFLSTLESEEELMPSYLRVISEYLRK